MSYKIIVPDTSTMTADLKQKPKVGYELDDDLVRDMTEVLTSFCARLYGRRAAKHRAEKALEAMRDERV